MIIGNVENARIRAHICVAYACGVTTCCTTLSCIISMTIKNLNIEEYLLGHCDAQQMHELASWASGSGKRLRLLFALRCAFLDLKYQHHFDDANLIATAEQRLFDAISKG